jgi:squalene cyclase
MTDSLDALRAARTAGAGWGYRPGEPSRVEPTAYALLALQVQGASVPPDAVAWLRANQNPDGSWGGLEGPDGPWVTAVVLPALRALGVAHDACERAESWLLDARSEQLPTYDDSVTNEGLVGWPWLIGTFGWVEPTAQAVRALRLAGRKHPRIEEAIRFLHDRRCEEGGWNYGTVRVRDITLPPYPNTTAQALIALATPGRTSKTMERDLGVLGMFLQEPLGTFDLAWGALAFDACGRDPAPFLTRLREIAHTDGAWRENVHALALAALASATAKGHNPFRLGTA